jgi:uncharacterized membrane protein
VDTYLLEWASLLLRWAHAIAGIAWVGAALYLFRPDKGLEDPRKWEAYWTWVTGFALLAATYYAGAEVYLVDPAVMQLSKLQAIGLGLAWLVGGLAAYEALCRSPLKRSDAALAAALLAFFAFAAWALTRTFGGRGAFIHYGALIGTIMVGNVAHVIVPGQRRAGEAARAGRAPDLADEHAGRQRSIHNTYLTLPVVLVMVSNHYAMIFGTAWNWLALVALTVAGVLIRAWFVMRQRGRANPWPLAGGLLALAGIAMLLAPRAGGPAAEKASFAAVKDVIARHCAVCHAERPAFPGIAQAPKGMPLDTPGRIQAHALQIHQQAVATRAMPPGNLTGLTDGERMLLDHWYRGGAKTD